MLLRNCLLYSSHWINKSNYETAPEMLILPALLVVFLLHLPCCCCDELIASICSPCGCLWRDRFRLLMASKLHIECKHNKIQAACVTGCFTSMLPSSFLISAERGGGKAPKGATRWLRFLFFPVHQVCFGSWISRLAGNAAGQFTLSGYACKECSLFVPASGLQPSFPPLKIL